MPWELDREFHEPQLHEGPPAPTPWASASYRLIWLLVGIVIGAAATYMLYPEQTRIVANQQPTDHEPPPIDHVIPTPPLPADTPHVSLPTMYTIVSAAEAIFVLPVPDSQSGYAWMIRVHSSIPPSHTWYEVRSLLTPMPASHRQTVSSTAAYPSTQVHLWRVDDGGQTELHPVDLVAHVRGDAVVIVLRGHDIVQEVFAAKPPDLCITIAPANSGWTGTVGGIPITYIGDDPPMARGANQASYC
jgi:hypothetical protein